MAADQTPEEYKTMREFGLHGTGVFLSNLAGGGTFISFREELTYPEAQRAGQGYAAFKWIPETVANALAVRNGICPIPGEPCGGAGKCTANGCICNPQTNRCVDVTQNGSDPSSGGGNQETPSIRKKDAISLSRRSSRHRGEPTPV